MRRYHLLEIHDQPWCPRAWREALTDTLQFLDDHGNYYAVIAPQLAAALQRAGAREIVDLCAGGGGPWKRLPAELQQQGADARVTLTDLYPNAAAGERLEKNSGGAVRYERESVDATRVPARLRGFRTLFTSFHHFRPELGRAILADAAAQGEGIGIFELTKRQSWPIFLLLLPIFTVVSVVGILLATPFIPPFRWSRLLWTYVIPVLPWMMVFDGAVSVMRSYTPAELLELARGLGGEAYEWTAGEVPLPQLMTMPVTYMIGVPRR